MYFIDYLLCLTISIDVASSFLRFNFDISAESFIYFSFFLIRSIISVVSEIETSTTSVVKQPVFFLWFCIPLLKLSIKNTKNLSKKHLAIIAEEINVKEVVEDKTLNDSLLLDTKLTKELIEDGQIRELIRGIQNQRKKTGCLTTDVVDVSISETTEMIDLIRKNEKYIKDSALISKLNLKKEDATSIEIVKQSK